MEQLALKPLEAVTSLQASQILKTDFISGLINNGRLIQLSNYKNGVGENVIYEVPDGMTFFLVSAALSCNAILANAGGCALYAGVTEDYHELLGLFSENVAANSKETSVSFPIPLKYSAKSYFSVVSGHASLNSMGNITGYEIPTALIPNFL